MSLPEHQEVKIRNGGGEYFLKYDQLLLILKRETFFLTFKYSFVYVNFGSKLTGKIAAAITRPKLDAP